MQKDTVIIGIDPGTIVTGYGIIKMTGNRYVALDYGCIKPTPGLKLTDRYVIIFDSVCELLDKFKPDFLSVEAQYVHKNVQSAIKLGMAKGIVLLAAKKRGILVYEYYPTQAKLAVVGNGKASKFQVQGMTQKLLNLSTKPQPDDASDALSLAICHAHSMQYNRSSTAEI